MKQRVQLAVVLALCLSILLAGSSLAFGATAKTHPATKRTPGVEAAQTLSMITGVAISPLLGVGSVGVYKWWTAPKEKRSGLPWFAQPWFWVPALALVAMVGFKDIAGATAPSVLKKPLDMAEAIENKVSALIAAGAFVPLVISIFPEAAGDETLLSQSPLYAAVPGIAMANVLLIPFALAGFAVVWLAFHAINVLIILSPFGLLDLALKSFRLGIFSFVMVTALLSPYLGAALSALLILGCYFIAGWSFRLTVFGSVYLWDCLTFRRRRFQPGAEYNMAFTARPFADVPVRTYGKLQPTASGLRFLYRPFLILPQRTLAAENETWVVGRRLISPEIDAIQGDKLTTFFVLPPRHLTHEEALARVYGIKEVRDVGILKSVKSAWGWLKAVCGYASSQTLAPRAPEGTSAA